MYNNKKLLYFKIYTTLLFIEYYNILEVNLETIIIIVYDIYTSFFFTIVR